MLSERPFRFTHAVEVRFRDLDALGHVNNAVYLTYFESARMAWWMHLTHSTDLRRMDMILARAEVDFRSPAAYAEVRGLAREQRVEATVGLPRLALREHELGVGEGRVHAYRGTRTRGKNRRR